jgi:hypothetical protein
VPLAPSPIQPARTTGEGVRLRSIFTASLLANSTATMPCTDGDNRQVLRMRCDEVDKDSHDGDTRRKSAVNAVPDAARLGEDESWPGD